MRKLTTFALLDRDAMWELVKLLSLTLRCAALNSEIYVKKEKDKEKKYDSMNNGKDKY
jgi:hypothetical protein